MKQPNETVVAYFLRLTQIPHCSHHADLMRDFLIDFATSRGYTVQTDEAGNVYATKGKPILCLQAHYDMVCMGQAPRIETYEENGRLKAKDSSLGADNGMGIAMMMALMDEGKELAFLFTADEEVGLIGAGALAFDLSNIAYMLNLDSEDEAEVYIGCAGGADIVATRRFELTPIDEPTYRIKVDGLPGGHSGVDIDKGIPNAIWVLADYLEVNDIETVVAFQGGSRRNAIPDSAEAIVCTSEPLSEQNGVTVEPIEKATLVYEEGHTLLESLHRFATGVRRYDSDLGIPYTSINLAIVDAKPTGEARVELSARAMDDAALSVLVDETVTYFERYGFVCEVTDKYPAWKPDVNALTRIVEAAFSEVFGRARRKAIHAGLECGIIARRYPHLRIASIGPTIRYPHSTRETVDLASVEKTFEALKRIVKKVEA